MPGGVWGQQAAGEGSGNLNLGFRPAQTYDPYAAYSRGGGNPAYFGPADGNVQKRQFAQVGKANINLLDPLAAERAGDYVPIDKPEFEGPLGGINQYYSASTPGGFFSGILSAVGGVAGKGGSDVGTFIGKTLEAPLGIVGGLGLDSVPFIAPLIDNANATIEENSPYILRDTLKIPKNVGGLFQSILNTLGLAGRAVERTYAGLAGRVEELPEDIRTRVESGELTQDQALDELVVSGRGFTNDPIHNMVFSILTDPVNWLTAGVGAVAGAAKGTASVARMFSAAARVEGSVVAEMAARGVGEVGALAKAAQAGEAIDVARLSRGTLGEMRSALNQDLARRVQNGEDIPSHLKLKMTERMGMSALGPVADTATENLVFRTANNIARATDPSRWFSGSKAGQRSMEQLHMASSTGVMAAIKPRVASRLTSLADDITPDGGDRIMEAIGTWGGNAEQEYVADLMAKDAMRTGAIPQHGSLSVTEVIGRTLEEGGSDTNIGKYIEVHVEKTKDIRVAALPEGERTAITVAKMARILDADPAVVARKMGKVSVDEAIAVHGLYYMMKGKRLHTDVANAIGEAANAGTLPKHIEPDDITMITPRTLTDKRLGDIDAAIKANDPMALRAAIERFDDFNSVDRKLVKDHELVDWVKDWLATNHYGTSKNHRSSLPREVLLKDANGNWLPGVPKELQDWAEDADTLGYGLANGMPADASLEARWRITHGPNGTIRHARPWLQFLADGIPAAKRLSRWDVMQMSMFRGIRGERILWNQRRRFITDMASDQAGNVTVPPELADRIFKALMYEASESRLLPRGMAPETMMKVVHEVLTDARAHSNQWGKLTGHLTERQVVMSFLRAMEGDVSMVGVTQKATGAFKSTVPGAGSNYWGQLSEKLYPLMRFTLNPVFMTMEATEPYILATMRGIRLPLRRDSEGFQQGLASYNAVRQFIHASQGPDGLMVETMEMNALNIYQAVAAKQNFGPRTIWGRIKGAQPAIAERKQAAAGLQARQLIGDNMYKAFKTIWGDEFDRRWGDLEYELGTVDRAELADRWMAKNLGLQDADGHSVSLSMDLMNPQNIGQRIRFSTNGSRPGDYTYGDVETLLDSAEIARSGSNGLTRAQRGLPAGEALLEDLRSMTEAEWLSEVERAGNVPRVGRISESAARDIWNMANGPKVEPFWKEYRKTYLRNLRGPTAVATRRLRDVEVANARAFVKAAAEGKALSEEEFIAKHFEEVPQWALDAGTLPPQVLTDIRRHISYNISRRRADELMPASMSGYPTWEKSGALTDPTDPIYDEVQRLVEGHDEVTRPYVYIGTTSHRLEGALGLDTSWAGDGLLATAYDKVGSHPLRTATRYGKQRLLRIKREDVGVARENISALKRPKSHDLILDGDLYAADVASKLEVFTHEGWKSWDEYVASRRGDIGGGVPKLYDATGEVPWFQHLFGIDETQTEPFAVDLNALLTDAERQATEKYTGFTYRAINGYLRGLEPDPDLDAVFSDERLDELIEQLDASIKKGVFRERKPLYRGVDLSDAYDEGEGIEHLYDLQVGQTMDGDPAFLSTSTSESTAQGFAGTKYGIGPEHRSVLIEYDMPPGTPTNVVEGLEGEYIMGRDMQFKVVGRETITDHRGMQIRLKVVPISEASQRGTNRLMMGDPPALQRNAARARHLAATDPAELRRLASEAPENVRQAVMADAEEAIAKAEAAVPATTLDAGGRKFGAITPEQALDDVVANVRDEDIPAFAEAWADTRERITDLARTSDDAELDGSILKGPTVSAETDMRLLASMAAAMPEKGGRNAVSLMLRTLEALWQRGPRGSAKVATAREQQLGLLVTQHLLRGVDKALATPRLPGSIDDSTDVLLGNTNRRHVGRTDLSQPIVADDAAYEGAGYLTQETIDDLAAAGHDVGAPPAVPAMADIGAEETTRVQSLGGTTGAELVEDSAGRRYVEKRGNSPEHITEEHYANDVYEAMGVPVPKQALFDDGGPMQRAAYIEGGVPLRDFIRTASPEEVQRIYAQLGEGFALDSLLANWDAIGLEGDNVLIKDGIAYRVDNGGSLRYRAQGAAKGERFGTTVGELRTLLDPEMNAWSARVNKHLSPGDIRRQVLDLDANRRKLLDALPEELRVIVSQRLDNMLDVTAGVTPSAKTGLTPVAKTEETHAYLVKFYNDMAKAANARGLGGIKTWTAADMPLLAARSRETLGRKPTGMPIEAIEQNLQDVVAEVYYPAGSDSEWMNGLLDLLNKPENRAARHQVMTGVQVNLLQKLRDEYGIIVDGMDDRGVGIWDGATPQPMVPLHLLSSAQRGDDLADILSYTMQQAEVWHYTVADSAVLARDGNWASFEPRVTITFDPLPGTASAEDVATKLAQQLPFAKGATAIQMPDGSWQLSIIDRDGFLDRLPDGQVDSAKVRAQLEETELGLGEGNLGADLHIDYGSTYVAGPDKLPDGTLDWSGHRDKTLAALQGRGTSADGSVLDGVRASHDDQVQWSLSEAAPQNYDRAKRREPITNVLEDSRGGTVFGTTTPVGASRAIVRGFGNTDAAAGIHELVHVFSIAGADPSLKAAVTKAWEQHVTEATTAASALRKRADAHPNRSAATRLRNRANALENGLQNPAPGQWGPAQEEFFVELVKRWIDRGSTTNPELGNALNHFRNWVKQQQVARTKAGLQPIELSDQMRVKLDRMFSRPGVETVPYSVEQEVMRQTMRQVARDAWNEAHTTQYYKPDRSMVERSVNHPYIGLYPASYMWGKVLPEMVRFLALRPFGMTTPFLAWNVLREVSDTVRIQSETDPSFKEFLADNEDAFMFLSMMFPALPMDIPANASLPLRRIAEQGLENQASYAAGAEEVPDIEFLRGAQDAIQYAVGPLGTLRTVSDISGMAGELINTMAGGEGTEGELTPLPLR